MGSNVEKIEKNVATIKIEVSGEDFKKAVTQAYQKNKSKFNIDGFRKGKVPQKIIEQRFGKNVFYEDAIDIAFPEAYLQAIRDNDLEPVARPSMESIEKIGDDGLTLIISVAIMPEVELGEYKGVEVGSLEYDPTDEDVDAELTQMQEQNSRLVSIADAKAKSGDTIVIDFEGFMNDVAFEGGKAEDHSLVLGSGMFIPGFEDQLIGAAKGDEVDVTVTFPEEYQAEDLAGQEALFKVAVKDVKVKEMADLDDEFAKDVSEFDTLEELKADLKAKAKEKRENALLEEAKVKVIDAAVESATFEIPDEMVQEEVDKSLRDFEYQLQMQGISMADYFNYTNMSEEDLMGQIKEDVNTRLSRDLVLSKITEVENIEAGDEDVAKEIEDQAKMYNMDVEKFKSTMTEDQREYFANAVKRRKTIDLLLEEAKK
ncbi:trigger factor [Alkalibacter rhizosphaerae]|uniref:Trigger factor n=1 Tax=Alkalibacter rhizosphaerae TaxID=2815577 RepID=A0A974XE59_9FIRM|nr:trigger factor [Alkalibacter rhizosphaerae]QSX08192.1 trigger factor [Alkalibacter rhizosphaerae]